MDQQLYSHSLQPFSQQIENPDLLATLDLLQEKHNGGRVLSLLQWKKGYIAVPVEIDVTLPPLGNFQNLDIREQETMLLVFSLENYPSIAPTVHPDRVDFPINQLAHLYIGRNSVPPPLCLVRGSLNEWYANKLVTDLITRTSNWLRDAASGDLSTDGDQFEPIRLEGYDGELIYDYDQLVAIASREESLAPDGNVALLQFERLPDVLSWYFTKHVPAAEVENSMKEVIQEAIKQDEDKSKKLLYHGYLMWSTDNIAQYNYDTALPNDWASFKSFCESNSIDVKWFEAELIARREEMLYRSIPLIVAVRRPKPIIGFSGNIELINFHVTFKDGDISAGEINPAAEVEYKKHTQPITCQKAREISGSFTSFEKVIIIAGCGALGSKIVLHLAKSGTSNMILADTDNLMAHNCIRHGLGHRDIGKNKAEALAAEIRKTCVDQKVWGLKTSGESLIRLSPNSTSYDWFFDFTASDTMLQQLINADGSLSAKVCRGYISDFGNLGILLFEGQGRNPRLDDLQIHLYAQGLINPEISEWLRREASIQEKGTRVMVGVGCHSETTVLADDVVSVHAGIFSSLIKEETKKTSDQGLIFLNSVKRIPYFQASTSALSCSTVDVLLSANSGPWQIRYFNGLLGRLQQLMHAAAPRETGGTLIGCANYKTHTIHVVNIIDAPPDSKATCTCFHRGIEGLKQSVADIVGRTGGLLGYIGEWHSHPDGPNGMSLTDLATIQRFKREYGDLPSPLPVFMMIVTPNAILPYVF